MSTLKVDGIRSNSASSDARTLAGDGTCTANITNNLSNRNLIINGAMQVAQRGTSSTADGYGSVDRFKIVSGSVDETPTHAQADVASGTTPYTLGFRKCLKITNGNQTGGAGSSDYLYTWTILEAQDVANSGWNYTSASSYITISYWVKSSVAQNFYGVLYTPDGTAQTYVWETGSLSADTWTKITKTIPGNSNIQFDNDDGAGLYIAPIRCFDGTDRTGSLTLNAWGAYSSSTRTPDQTSTWYTTNDATLEVTGLQLEVGSVATDFEHRSYAQELALCQRYCQVYPKSTGDNWGTIFNGYIGNANWMQGAWTFPEMRSAPSATSSGSFRILRSNTFDSVSSLGFYHGNRTSLNVQAVTSVTYSTLGGGATVSANNDSTAKITLSAEL